MWLKTFTQQLQSNLQNEMTSYEKSTLSEYNCVEQLQNKSMLSFYKLALILLTLQISTLHKLCAFDTRAVSEMFHENVTDLFMHYLCKRKETIPLKLQLLRIYICKKTYNSWNIPDNVSNSRQFLRFLVFQTQWQFITQHNIMI